MRRGLLPCLGFACTTLLLFTQCRFHQDRTPSAVVVKEHTLTRFSSGSGLVLYKDSAYIIGDDAPYIGRLALKNNRLDQIAISGLAFYDTRIPKPLKPDYEAALTGPLDGKEYFFAFGSGSQSPERDSLLFFPIDQPDQQQKVSLSPFYAHMQQSIYHPQGRWNLEGATKVADSLVLLNRGNNMVINVSWNQFTSFALGVASEFPYVSYRRVRLPDLKGREARFSGACTLDDRYLVVCASVEDTPDWNVDGPVLGSFVALLDRETYQLKSPLQVTTWRGRPYIHKIESLEVLKKEKHNTLLLEGLVDDDNGKTRLIRIRYTYAP